jgi:hypothetical protein
VDQFRIRHFLHPWAANRASSREFYRDTPLAMPLHVGSQKRYIPRRRRPDAFRPVPAGLCCHYKRGRRLRGMAGINILGRLFLALRRHFGGIRFP